jgi:hypothetical protein
MLLPIPAYRSKASPDRALQCQSEVQAADLTAFLNVAGTPRWGQTHESKGRSGPEGRLLPLDLRRSYTC